MEPKREQNLTGERSKFRSYDLDLRSMVTEKGELQRRVFGNVHRKRPFGPWPTNCWAACNELDSRRPG